MPLDLDELLLDAKLARAAPAAGIGESCPAHRDGPGEQLAAWSA